MINFYLNQLFGPISQFLKTSTLSKGLDIHWNATFYLYLSYLYCYSFLSFVQFEDLNLRVKVTDFRWWVDTQLWLFREALTEVYVSRDTIQYESHVPVYVAVIKPCLDGASLMSCWTTLFFLFQGAFKNSRLWFLRYDWGGTLQHGAIPHMACLKK